MTSILESIKKLLGITEEQKNFDADLIMYINSVFVILHQMGVGPEKTFSITDELNIWDEFIPEAKVVELVKPYIYLKVKLMFDPPLSSSVQTAMEKIIAEHEWRLTNNTESALPEEEE